MNEVVVPGRRFSQLLKHLGQHDDQIDFLLQQPGRDVRDEEREIILDLRGGSSSLALTYKSDPSASINRTPENTRSNTARPTTWATRAWMA